MYFLQTYNLVHPFLWHNGSKAVVKNVKSLQKDGRKDRRQTTGDQKLSFELLIQVSLISQITFFT